VAHRYRLYPDLGQLPILEMHCSHARRVWNLALDQWSMWRPGRRRPPGSTERMRQLAEARASSWLGEGSSAVQQQALRDFDRAVANFFAGTHRRPRWRRKGLDEGFCVRDVTVRHLSRRWAALRVPKLGWVRFRLSRPLPEGHGMARVTLDRAGRWHVSFAHVPPQIEGPGTAKIVGVDRGVANTVALSTGERVSCPQTDWPKIRRLQRRLARQQRGSKRREATRRRLARLRAREADRRKDWVEKVTTRLARDFDVTRVEDLRVKQMMRSAKGTVDAPGRNVAAKAGLNRSISEQGWSMFARRLGDKIGDRLELVPAPYTSQTCSACGHCASENRDSQAVFRCVACGHYEHADVNAAKVIAAGRAVCGRGGIGATGPPSEASTILIGAA
jgi:putative transposase